MATAKLLNKTEAQVRDKASRLGLKVQKGTEFWMEWQSRAAKTKVGKDRPDQSIVMLRLHSEGKLVRTNESRKLQGEGHRQWIAKNGHPRGSLGMKHSEETRQLLGKASRDGWNQMTPEQREERTLKIMKTKVARGNLVNECPQKSWKAAWREIGGKRKYYRSRWEANYARLLEWQKVRGEVAEWSHEPETFWFEGIKRGCVSYLPDFKVTFPDGHVEYHEVKGWFDDRSKTKIKRMAKYHPDVVLKVIDSKAYGQLERLFKSTIPGWELKNAREEPASLAA